MVATKVEERWRDAVNEGSNKDQERIVTRARRGEDGSGQIRLSVVLRLNLVLLFFLCRPDFERRSVECCLINGN